MGFMISPLLWEKIARGLSAGRVQSVAVKLVVEREREIRAFIPEEYWQVFADTKSKKMIFVSKRSSKMARRSSYAIKPKLMPY